MEGKIIYQKIADIMKEFGAIEKTQKNTMQGFMYRGIDDVYLILQPLLAKHEVFTITEVLSERSEERQTKAGGNLIYRILSIKYTFYATDGSSVSATVIGEGMDTGDKAANKAMAVGHKYAILQTFCVPTEEPKDPDKDSYETKPKTKPLPSKTTTKPDQPKVGNKPPKSGDLITTPQRNKLWAMMMNVIKASDGGPDKELSKQFYDYMQPETKAVASGFIERFDDIFKLWNGSIYDVECATGEMVALKSCIGCKDIKTCQQLTS